MVKEFTLYAIHMQRGTLPPGEERPEGEWVEFTRLGQEFYDARFPPPLSALYSHGLFLEEFVEVVKRARLVTFVCREQSGEPEKEEEDATKSD